LIGKLRAADLVLCSLESWQIAYVCETANVLRSHGAY
jgi:hypothetical protein